MYDAPLFCFFFLSFPFAIDRDEHLCGFTEIYNQLKKHSRIT